MTMVGLIIQGLVQGRGVGINGVEGQIHAHNEEVLFASFDTTAPHSLGFSFFMPSCHPIRGARSVVCDKSGTGNLTL